MSGRISVSCRNGLSGSNGQPTFDRLIMDAVRVSHETACKIVVGALSITAAADLVTGTKIWLGPMYLLVICLATWSLGARRGLIVAGACLGTSILANGESIYAFEGLVLAWNVAARAFAALSMIVLVAAFRRSYVREWRRGRIDHLTGALTRNAFLEEVRILAHAGGPAVLAYVDLDNFKAINDTYGHAAGDDLLCLFSQTIQSHTRESDRFGRVGGDEFLIYLAVSDEQHGQHAIKAVHGRVNDALCLAGYASGCSAGAIFIDSQVPVTDADVVRADQLMYGAKIERRSIMIGPRYVEPGAFLEGGPLERQLRLSDPAHETRAAA